MGRKVFKGKQLEKMLMTDGVSIGVAEEGDKIQGMLLIVQGKHACNMTLDLETLMNLRDGFNEVIEYIQEKKKARVLQ